MEYINAWRQATDSAPAGICGPLGPTEQLPLEARPVNELDLNLQHAHFGGMGEWVANGRKADARIYRELESRALCRDAKRTGQSKTFKNIIVVKSALAWQAAYGDIAKRVMYVDTPGICTANLHTLPYKNVRRPIFPLDKSLEQRLEIAG